ncbi:gamma-glutamyltransferase [Mesorhizobium sp. L-8-3]|uniref:gamma-glutamyltransferase n=1 Tax=Mesorhizobium sp. L-8-3 TaxID=2744522 RepID=UPI0019283DCC|nr:gamma-glutamyltransferase [Mesorhizobium sp. L-8-3]BCH25593.1 gamma-glutamyltranspeptidase [Mesorhizobium sp. L-8-3]
MKQARLRSLTLAALLAVLAPAAHAQQASDVVAPEGKSGITTRAPVHAGSQMVAAANPLAAQAGLAVLRDGGNAADALVAVQAVLGLVEPQSSGLGGGAFLTWYDASTGNVTTFDGRETAPAAATPNLFLGADGKPLEFFDAVVGGRSVGTPGVPRLLETVHARYGKRPWAGLFDRAIELGEKGFAVSARLNVLLVEDGGRLDQDPAARAYFFGSDGKPLATGTELANPDYAATLKAMAAGGADAFYKGAIAEKIVAAVQGHATNPGGLTLADLAGYEVKERSAVCAPYRGHQVCGMGPPSSGAIAIGQILGMIEPFDIATLGPDDPVSWRIIGDATRLAFADRERFVADSDFVTLPKGLLDADYLKSRSALLRRDTALGPDEASAGEPPWDKAELRIDGRSLEQPSTSHFTVVDKDGNIAAMTSSIENGFGSRMMAAGFLLNNQLTDFSFEPEADGEAVANRVEAGKRPRSSMSPTIVLRDGKPVFALGSPGGSRIIPYVATTIIALIDWKMDMQAAISLPHMVNRFGTYDLEAGTPAEGMADDLEALGYEVKVRDLNSGLHGIAIDAGGLTGGADPRREGVALGD